MSSPINLAFKKTVQENRPALLTYTVAGDNSKEISLKILKSAAKQLNESIDQYQKGGREELAEKEAFELTLLEKYLPEQLSEEQIRQTVKNIVKNTGAGSMQDMGKIMGTVMKELAGSADGKLVQKIVQEELSS